MPSSGNIPAYRPSSSAAVRAYRAESSSTVRARTAPPERVRSLDVFRGLTIAAMILVTDPGTYSYTYHQLRHAAWDGATATDMIFPSFLFIVGMAITLSLPTRLQREGDRAALIWHVLGRSVLLIVVGLIVNGFPDYVWQTLRLPGILQRIGLCYMVAGTLYAFLLPQEEVMSDNSQRRLGVLGGVFAGVLVLYWFLLKSVNVPGIGAGHLDSFGNFPAYLDRNLFGVLHLWPYGLTQGMGVTYDPEGLLSTLGALATTLLGVLAGEWMSRDIPRGRKGVELTAGAFILLLLSLAFGHWMPVNKSLWTPTFVMFAGSISLGLFVFFWITVDWWNTKGWTLPGLIFGTNAILAFVLSSILTTLSDRIKLDQPGGGTISLRNWINDHWFATHLPPLHASLAYAVAVVLLNMLLIYPLYRKKIFLRL